MQRYTDVVQRTNGNAVSGVAVTVTTESGATATIYSSNSYAAESNPIYTGTDGEYSFFAPNGKYTLSFSRSGFAAESKEVLLFDPEDAGVISVKDSPYNARGDGSTDDTTAIQAAIDANGGKAIYLPPGIYKITSTLTIEDDYTQLVGSFRATWILNAGTGDAVAVRSASTGQSDYVVACSVRDLLIYRATHSVTVGAGVRLTQGNSCELRNVYVLSHPEGIRVVGGQLNTLDGIQLAVASGMSDISATADSAQLAFLEASTSGGTYQACYTNKLSNFAISCNLKTQAAILVANADGLQIGVGYVNNSKEALIRFKCLRDSTYVAGVTVTSVYFDCVNGATDRCVDAPADGFASSVLTNIQFAACDFSGADEEAVKTSKPIASLSFGGGCVFKSSGKAAVDYTATSSSGTLSVVGCTALNVGSDGGTPGVFKVDSALGATFAGNTVAGLSGCGAAFVLAGTISCVTITGNTIRSADTDLSNSATITDFSYSGNNSTNTAAATGLMGLRVNNQANDDTKAFDWYEEGTFTPTVTFGGASVGVTYSSRSGTYTRFGNRVSFDLTIVLSSKGSSTGNAAFGGLPFTAADSAPCPVRITTVTSGVGDSALMGLMQGSGTSVRIDKIATGSVVQMTDADLTNSSDIRISGVYRV